MATITSIISRTLDLPPSCIAFCPSRPQVFVVGTYFLHPKSQALADAAEAAHGLESQSLGADDKADGNETFDIRTPQKRTGSLIVFSLVDDKITLLSEVATDFAVLDIQWAPAGANSGDLLAVAASTGLLAFYKLVGDDNEAFLDLSHGHRIAEPEILVLSLTWNDQNPDMIGATFSDGNVGVCTTKNPGTDHALVSSNTEIALRHVHFHELEAWCMTFGHRSETDSARVVYSGGDDMSLQASRLQTLDGGPEHSDGDIEDDSTAAASLLWRDRRSHQAGVTAILPLSASLAVTGSYDDHIRLLSTPEVGRRQVLAEENLGGGVWRLKLLDGDALQAVTEQNQNAGEDTAARLLDQNFTILASCMHAGTRIVRLTYDPSGESWHFHVDAKFEEHKSMNYGSDVQPEVVRPGIIEGSLKGRQNTIVSTSFYDRLLCLWKWPPA